MQLLYIRFCKTKTRSKRTNIVENIWFFRILIDLILWQILIKSKKLEFAFFVSLHVFHIDFSIVFNFAHIVDIIYKFSTIKIHRNRIIDVAKNIWKLWNSQWCYQNHDIICIFVNIALFRQLIFVSWYIFYSILDIRFHIDVSFHEETQNVFNYSIARFINSILRHIWNQ